MELESLEGIIERVIFYARDTGYAVISLTPSDPLKSWAEDLLDEDALRRDGVFRPKRIRRCWTEHLERQRDWKYHLWGLLMFQAWKREWNAYL